MLHVDILANSLVASQAHVAHERARIMVTPPPLPSVGALQQANAATQGSRHAEVEALIATGASARDCRSAGFTATELRSAGFNLADLWEAGFSVPKLEEAGFSARKVKAFRNQARRNAFHAAEERKLREEKNKQLRQTVAKVTKASAPSKPKPKAGSTTAKPARLAQHGEYFA